MKWFTTLNLLAISNFIAYAGSMAPPGYGYRETILLAVVATGQENDPWNGKEIHANNGKFWIGKPTTSKCTRQSEQIYECPEGNRTVFHYISDRPGPLNLDTAYPKGYTTGHQEAYVAEDGSLSFLRVGEDLPTGAVTGEFFTDMIGELTVRNPKRHRLIFPSSLCLIGSVYQVFFFSNNTLPKNCQHVHFLTVLAYGAYEYT